MAKTRPIAEIEAELAAAKMAASKPDVYRRRRQKVAVFIAAMAVFAALQALTPKESTNATSATAVTSTRPTTPARPIPPALPQVTVNKEKPWALIVMTMAGKPGQRDFKFSTETIAAYATKAICEDMRDSPWMDGIQEKTLAAARRGGVYASAWDGKLTGEYTLRCLKLTPDGKHMSR